MCKDAKIILQKDEFRPFFRYAVQYIMNKMSINGLG